MNVLATYEFNASDEGKAKEFATQIASGQTLGFVPKDSSWNEWVAKVLSVERTQTDKWRSQIAFPSHLFGNDMAGMLTVLFGKISFAPSIHLTKISCEEGFEKTLRGPRYGLQGILERTAAKKSPLLMAILKPGIGPVEKLAEAFAELSDAGVHIVKDDEVCIDATVESQIKRLHAVLKRKKNKTLYVHHLNGIDFMKRAVRLQSEGAEAFLFCPYTYGVASLQELCSNPEIKVPIFVHPAFTGPMTSGGNAISASVALGTLMRWCGADAVLYPSPYGSIALPKQDALDLHEELIKDSKHLKICASVPSAGISVEHVPIIKKDFGSQVIINAGTGMAKGHANLSEGVKKFLEAIG